MKRAMRWCLIAVVVCATGYTNSLGGLPKGVFKASELGDAVDEASRARKPIAFLLADSSNEKEEFIDNQNTAVRSLKSYAVIVYVEANDSGLDLMPPPVWTALQDVKISLYIPRFVLAAPDLSATWGGTSTQMISGDDSRKFLKRAEDESTTKMAGWKPGVPIEDQSKMQFKWGGKENKYFSGRFDRLDDTTLFLSGPNGEPYRIARDKLTDASLKFAQNMALVAAAGRMPEFEVEAWTSSDGRTMRAKFVGLEGDRLTVETAAGKRFTFPLERLDAASGQRAKARAEQVAKALAE